jgi:hypothetical protein
MARFERFTFLVDKQERQLITSLAKHLKRSQSDAVRYLIANSAWILTSPPQGPLNPLPSQPEIPDMTDGR